MKYNPYIFSAPTNQERDNNKEEWQASQEELYYAYYGAEVNTIPSFFTPFSKPQEAKMMAADLLMVPLGYFLAGLVNICLGHKKFTECYSPSRDYQPFMGLAQIGAGIVNIGIAATIDAWVLLALATRTLATAMEAVTTLFSDENHLDNECNVSEGMSIN